MAVAIALVLALAGGAALPAALGALSIPQLITLAQFGVQGGVAGIKLGIAVNKELDRRFPCDVKCHRFIATHRFDMNGGPIGWGRSPYKYM